MTKLICDACKMRIKVDAAMVLVNTADTSNHWHLACCPLVREPTPEAGQDGKPAGGRRAA